MRRLILVGFVLMIALPGGAVAQTNLGIVGGALFPVSDFGDVVEVSPYIGARFEIQDVNALGHVAVLTYIVQGGFALLQRKEIEGTTLLGATSPNNDDGSYFDIGLGLRAYSSANPLFLSIGLSYVNLGLGAGTDNLHAGDGYIGLGLVADRESWKFEIEMRINAMLVEGGEDLQHFQALASLGFPF